LLTVKTAAAALAVTSVGGLALAAGTGTLPTPLATHPRHADQPTTGADNPTTVVPTPTAAALRDAAKAAAAVDRDDATAGKNASASYTGLCTAFAAGKWDNARAAGNPAFARLVAAAPGGDVTDFCQALADEAPAGKNPGSSAARPAKPTNNGTSHAAGQTAHKGKPAAKGKPANKGKAAVSKAPHANKAVDAAGPRTPKS
jgi:hypothetical protein